MRISTNTIYELGTARITEMQTSMAKTQQQVASGRRMLSPADDPIGAARVLELSQGKSINEQYAVNRQNARNALELQEGVLASVTTLIQDVRELVVRAGNGTLDDQQRGYIATELHGRFDDLLALANSRDGAGNHLFAGYRVASQPFSATPQGALYSGDQGQRMLQVGPGRQVAVSDSGAEVFERVRTGNGTFSTAAAAGNQGGGIISPGVVTDAGALTGHQYRIEFHVAGDAVTYDVVDLTEGVPVSTGNAFRSGAAISFGGLQTEVKGQPADGDSFLIEPSRSESVFATLASLIDVLRQPAQDTAGKARLGNGLSRAGAELDSMLGNVLEVRASLGARLKEIDSLDSAGSQRDLQYAQAISELQDVDYARALSDLSRQQMILEAAQKSFVAVTGLSLFKIL